MASKTCPECQEKCGPRSAICPKCKHSFGIGVKASDEKMTVGVTVPKPIEKREKVEKQPFVPSAGSKNKGRLISYPSGTPPVKPAGYKQDWPDGPASKEVIQDWARATKEAGFKDNLHYLPTAVVYFARYFWDIHNEVEYNRVVQAINSAISSRIHEEESDTSDTPSEDKSLEINS